MTPLAGIAKRAATSGRVGKPVARTLHMVGAEHTSRKIAILNGAPAPVTAEIALPRSFASRTLRMDTDAGREQIAMRAWTHGWKDFEKPLPRIYAACIPAGGVVLDVGANSGFYALLGASVSPDVSVHAFEPLPAAVRQLRLNLAMNPQGARVVVVPKAVDTELGEIDLLVPPGDHAIPTSASLEPDFQPVWAGSVRVERTTVDHYAADLPRVDVLRIDVEGAEPRVLEGARGTLLAKRPVVFFEAINHGDVWRADVARIEALRAEVDYRSVLLHKDCVIVRPVVAWESGCENQALWPAERIRQLRDLSGRLHITYAD